MTVRTLTVEDIARYCRVSQLTVLQWVQQERLRAFRSQSGQYMIPVREFQAFLRLEGMPVDGLYFHSGGTPKRVLAVSEDDDFVEFLVRSLCQSSSAVQVFSAHSWPEARCQITSLKPDLVLLGPTHCDSNAAELGRWLRQSHDLRHVKVLAVAGSDASPHLLSSLHAAADEVVQGPLDAAAVRKQVYALLSRTETSALL